MSRFRRLLLLAVLLPALGMALLPVVGRMLTAGEVKLKNRMVLRGVPTNLESMIVNKPNTKKEDPEAIKLYPILMIATPLKRYFIPVRQSEEVNKDASFSTHEGFKIPQKGQKGRSREIGAVQGYVNKPTPFTSSGQRTVTLEMAKGPEEVDQGVTLITPEYMKVTALNYKWETAIATSSVPVETLDAMLRQVTRADNADDRLKIARFYIAAGLYEPAERELELISKKFPMLAGNVAQVKVLLTEAQTREILAEMKLRRAAGQHAFVYQLTQIFPVDNVPAPILREVREMTDDYNKARERGEQILAELGELQGQLKNDPRVKEIAPLRAEIAEKLTYSSLDRLDSYTKLAADPKLKAEEKLALALSGWVVGSSDAVTELDQALRFWQARFLVQDYLRSADEADAERKAILAKLEALESVGPERIAQILPLLPPVLDPSAALTGNTVRVQVPTQKGAPATAYWVSLPIEYHPDHKYPVIVALHSEGGSPNNEIERFWASTEGKVGQSQRHGYIVIAPEYVAGAKIKTYDYAAESHQIVLDSLRDARHRFSIDSDRVFLAGHGTGGDAVWDIGFSHPHLFAGAISISGVIDRHAKYYLENGRDLPLYAVAGELDRDRFGRNALSFMKLMKENYNFIYNEYKGSGPESFYSEIHALFEWMELQRRPAPPKEVSGRTLRETDNRLFWLEFSDLKKGLDVDWSREKQGGVKPALVTGKISPGNVVHIKSGAAHYRVWLPRGPGLVDFDKKLRVEIGGKVRFNDFVKPDEAAMLEHVRLTGDRQQLYWGMLEF